MVEDHGLVYCDCDRLVGRCPRAGVEQHLAVDRVRWSRHPDVPDHGPANVAEERHRLTQGGTAARFV